MKPTNEGAPPRGPFRGQFGACFRHAIAALLDLPIGEVPMFDMGLSIPDRAKRRREQMRETREWLAPQGRTVWWFPIRAATLAEALQKIGSFNPDMRYFIYGATAWKGLNHTVCCLGNAVEFSPGIGVDILGPAWPECTHYHVWIIAEKL